MKSLLRKCELLVAAREIEQKLSQSDSVTLRWISAPILIGATDEETDKIWNQFCLDLSNLMKGRVFGNGYEAALTAQHLASTTDYKRWIFIIDAKRVKVTY